MKNPAVCATLCARVKRLPIRFTLILSILAFAMINDVANAADPIGDFFKRLGNSMAHAKKHPSKKTAGSAQLTNKNASPTPSPGEVSPSPTEQTQRAVSAPPEKGKKRDAPYAIPVPNKPGFVTSPFSPNGGFVDVRGFPSGTEVKDPYTGKIFLTP